MQKTFKNQQGREFLLLDLPSDASEFELSETCHPNYRRLDFVIVDVAEEIHLPKGNYQILCLAKNATEEQLKKVLGDNTITSLGFKQDDNVLILEKV